MKRFLTIITGFVTVFLLAGTANAQISASSYEAVMATSKPTAGYDGGFFIQSSDGDFKLIISPRIDTMFFWESENVPDDANTAENESLDTLTFRLRRAQLLTIATWKKFTGLVLIGAAVPGGNDPYWVVYGEYEINPFISVKWGVDDMAYDFFSITSSKRMTMVDYPIVVTQKDGEQPVWADLNNSQTIVRPSLGLPTQIAIFLSGNAFNKRLQWNMAIGNGTESTDTLNLNRQFTYALRLTGIILGEDPYGDMTDLSYSETPSLGMSLGGAFEHDDAFRNAGTAAAPNWLKMYNWALDGTADMAFKYRGFSLSAAGYYRQIKVGPGAVIEAGEKYLTDFGYLAAVAMFAIPKKLEFQAFGSQIFREGPDNNIYEFGGGLNYYIRGHNCKFMIDYSRVVDFDDIQGTNHRSHNRVRAKLAMYF